MQNHMRERLLERIREAETGQETILGSVDSQAVMNSVQRHLMLLLNTQKGSVPIADDYGVPDFFSLLGMGDVEAITKLERMIENVISKYEPRLRNVSIHVTNRNELGSHLHMQITASLNVGKDDLQVSFDTVLDSGGRFRVE